MLWRSFPFVLLTLAPTSIASAAESPPQDPAVTPAATQESALENEPAPGFRNSFSLGAAYFGSRTSASHLDRFGLMVEGGGVAPIYRRLGLGVRFSWGLTEFQRFEKWTELGHGIGKWTTTAYGDVYEWSAQKDKYQSGRVIGRKAVCRC